MRRGHLAGHPASFRGSKSLNRGHHLPWSLRPHVAGTAIVLCGLFLSPYCPLCLVTADKNPLKEHVLSLPFPLPLPDGLSSS